VLGSVANGEAAATDRGSGLLGQDRGEGWQALVRRRRSRRVGRRVAGSALEADEGLGQEAVGQDEGGAAAVYVVMSLLARWAKG
jgi:hypothetical protein